MFKKEGVFALYSCLFFQLTFSCHIDEDASEGIRQSPRGDSPTLPTLGPSGIHERLNC